MKNTNNKNKDFISSRAEKIKNDELTPDELLLLLIALNPQELKQLNKKLGIEEEKSEISIQIEIHIQNKFNNNHSKNAYGKKKKSSKRKTAKPTYKRL